MTKMSVEEKAEKKERKKKNKEKESKSREAKERKDVASAKKSRARWKSECELDDCGIPGVALGPWPVRVSDTSSYVLGQIRTQTWGCGDSDAISDLPSDALSVNHDVLSTAGMWTEVEALTIYFRKLHKLRRLYHGQIDRLQHEFRLLRHRYLCQQQHIDNGGTINSTARMPVPGDSTSGVISPAAQVQNPADGTAAIIAKRASAVRRYKRFYGQEAVMQHRVRERRRKARLAAVSPSAYEAEAASNFPQCSYIGHGSLQCQATCLPMTKFCKQHICADSSQCLFTPCEHVLSGGQKCNLALPGYCTIKRCFLHIDLPPVNCRRTDVDSLKLAWGKLKDEEHSLAVGSLSGINNFLESGSSVSTPTAATAASLLSEAMPVDLPADLDLVRPLSLSTAATSQCSSGTSSVSCLSASVTPPLPDGPAPSLLSTGSVALVSEPLSALSALNAGVLCTPATPEGGKSVTQASINLRPVSERPGKPSCTLHKH